MTRTTTVRLLTSGALVPMALALAVGAATAAAKPAAVLVKQGDAICRADDAKRAHIPNPPSFQNPAKATKAQLEAAAPYMTRDLAITKDEVRRVFAQGTPSEPAARKEWTKLRRVLTGQLIPTYARAIAAMKAGDHAGVVRAFQALDRVSASQNLLLAELGFKVCGH
jgi:hypothetical protein